MPARTRRHDTWLVVIGIGKLLKAAVLIAVGTGLLELIHQDAGRTIARWALSVHVHPTNRYLMRLIDQVDGLSGRKEALLGVATFAYAALFVTEGVGLLLKKRWAEYFTVIATTSLIPLELYELVRELTAIRVAIFVVNVAIVAYLVYRLRTDRRA